jgi:hypothetical protein
MAKKKTQMSMFESVQKRLRVAAYKRRKRGSSGKRTKGVSAHGRGWPKRRKR